MKRYQIFLTTIAFGGLTLLMGCTPEIPGGPVKDLKDAGLIPIPRTLESSEAPSFLFSSKTAIVVAAASKPGDQEQLQRTAEFLAARLRPATGWLFPVAAQSGDASVGHIYLRLVDQPELGVEGYQMQISKDSLLVEAQTPNGIFYGVQTLRQLLPADVEGEKTVDSTWAVAAGNIIDYPEYGYRGAMLDVARHFFNVDEVKRFIDLMVPYKLNHLHLHLSDDQGWRIEIKSWPKLTEIGGSTEVGGASGGFFTQEQYKELVQYAQDRFITIVPEIDMPGHTNAALASYAELNCNDKATELYEGTEVGFSTLCTDKEVVYQFIDDVVREISEISPGPYFHIGGDESHVTPLKDYIPFIERVQTIVKKYNKRVLGWDEITHAKLQPNSVAQYWADAENAKRAIDQGCQLLISPARRAYLDMKYDSTSSLGLSWAAFIEVQDGYDWNPTQLESFIQKDHIIGIEAPLWSETVTNVEDFEYLLFPRLPGYGEISWSDPADRNWDDYKVRLGKQGPRFEVMGINYYQSPQVPWVAEQELRD